MKVTQKEAKLIRFLLDAVPAKGIEVQRIAVDLATKIEDFLDGDDVPSITK